MSKIVLWRGASLAALIVFLTLTCLPSVEALSLRESRNGVWGLVTDMDGNPVEGVKVHLMKVGREAEKLTVETNRKGTFQYPRVDFHKDGYRIAVESSTYFVREFQIRVRRATREIWQDDSGKLTPESQDLLPVIRYRGANCTVDFKLGLIEEFSAARAAADAEKRRQEEARLAAQKAKDQTPAEIAEDAYAYGDYGFAAEKYKEALEEDPENADLLWGLADSSALSGDTGAALRAARKVLRLDPQRVGVRLKMAQWMDGMGRIAAAVPMLEEERALDAGNTQLLRMLVAAYDAAEMEDKKVTAIEDWAEAAPEDSSALLALATLRAEQKDFAAAEELYSKIAAMDPEGAHRMLFNAGASILNKSGAVSADDRKRAIAAFEKAIELKPDYARPHLMAGDAYVGLGDFTKAREHYQRYLELVPADDPQVGKVKGLLSALPQ